MLLLSLHGASCSTLLVMTTTTLTVSSDMWPGLTAAPCKSLVLERCFKLQVVANALPKLHCVWLLLTAPPLVLEACCASGCRCVGAGAASWSQVKSRSDVVLLTCACPLKERLVLVQPRGDCFDADILMQDAHRRSCMLPVSMGCFSLCMKQS
jgi:hypothetical protein